ncbi:TonB-dependent receptor [Niveispirillum cyanobacteriorum]|nr:TonB-dependent receptor [Niveispirillum cyanobacteriorum]
MRFLASALLSGASALIITHAVAAQTAAGQAEILEEVIVTGSRVIKDGANSPSPVTVIGTDDLLTTQPGATLAEALNSLPVFSGSRGSASNPTTVGSAAGGNGSANQLNLRNIGPTRTLVLMDGKRVPPTLFNGVVDVDIIPQLLVERVDVVTGGVSAVYGSDAMTGVVNYVINRKLQGLRADVSYGVSEQGDATKFNTAMAYGTDINDRVHVEFSYEYRDEGGIDNRTDRDWLNQVGVTGAGTAASPYFLQTNLRQKDFPFGGLITTGALAGQVFKTNGALSPFVAGTATGTSAIQIGGDGGYWDSGLIAQLEGHQLFGRLDHDVTDDIHAYAQLSGTFKTNSSYAETNQLNGVAISRTNAFLSPQIQALIPANQPTFRFSKFMADVPRIQAVSDSEQIIATTGFDGRAGGINWAIDYTHGEAVLDTDLNNVINRQKLWSALDAVVNPANGQTVCNITLTNPALANGCVPLNVFGPNASAAEAIGYVTDTIAYHSKTVMNDIAGQVGGSPFDTWAGPVNAALSAEWRKVSFSSESGAAPSDVVDCTGIRFNCTAGTQLTESVFGETAGVSQTVYEAAVEFDAPLLVDSVLAKSLNVNGAARYTHYNTSGTYWTWKLGIDWHVTDEVRLRGTRSRDIRAPTLYDLFSPTTIIPVRPTDLLTGLSPTTPQVDEGNPDLTAEIGNTVTAGIVWQPSSDLNIAVDGYRIRISDAVTQIAGSTPAYQQACYASGGTSPYCLLQERPNGFADRSAANAVTRWLTKNINLSEIETWGIDTELNYSAELLDRPMMFRVLAAWQPHVYYRQPNVATLDQGGVAFGPLGLAATPSVRLSAFFRFQPVENVTVDISQRWRNAMKLGGDPSQVWVKNRIGAFATTGINVAWDTSTAFGNLQIYGNVQNVFDATPPIGGFSGNGTRAGLRDGFALGDDPRGRYFTAGAKIRF